MAKLITIFLIILFSVLIAMPNGNQATEQTEETSSWFKNICEGKENVAEIHFYVQDLLAGENKTVYEVAQASITPNSTTGFGQVLVVDDLLTAEPDINSEEVGRVQGLVTSADLTTSALAMNLNFYFTSGKYNGSTISILGRNQILSKEREVPVVGGTGFFRFARGYAITKTYSYNVRTSHGVLEYTLYVTYNDESSCMHA